MIKLSITKNRFIPPPTYKFRIDLKTVDVLWLESREETKTIESVLPQIPSQYKPNPKQCPLLAISVFQIYNEFPHKLFQLCWLLVNIPLRDTGRISVGKRTSCEPPGRTCSWMCRSSKEEREIEFTSRVVWRIASVYYNQKQDSEC